jgi:hypothetical protein
MALKRRSIHFYAAYFEPLSFYFAVIVNLLKISYYNNYLRIINS